jgi:CubicO group peptidase (beta-lactamase class C family)
MDLQRFARIEATAKSHVDRGHFSGIEWLVLRGGRPWANGRVGWADAPNRVPIPDKPLYRIFSMTKPVISAMALMLMERGQLNLFQPISAFLPEFAEMSVIVAEGGTSRARMPIIVEHLLTHRSGLSLDILPNCPVGRLYAEKGFDTGDRSLADFVGDVAQMPLAFEPGSEWRYSVSLDVLARIIEVILGRDLPDILQEFIFSPLGMDDTAYFVPESQRNRIMQMFGKSDLTKLFDFEPGPQTLVRADISDRNPADNPEFRRGGYGLFSTSDDYASFVSFLATGLSESGERLLSRKTVELMWTNRIPPRQQPLFVGPILLPGYGYGLAGRVMIDIGQALGLTSKGECGWAGAASTYFWIDPQEDLIGITLAQFLGSKVPLGDEMRRAVYQALDEC